ncbi:MAG: EAL domain-containing protein [Candidatus Thiodiazotropha taylori]|nr:EAL domain-containing protein [Candidatus Thiodiazotropha taylori]
MNVEKKVRQYESDWQRLVAALSYGVFVLDGEGVIIFANDAAADLFGRSITELIGTPFSFPILTGTPSEISVIQPNNIIVKAEMSVALGAWEGEDAWLVSMHNITERKLAEEKLKQAASVFEYAQEGIVITDPDAIVLEVNDTFCRITGFPRHEILGKNPRILASGRHGKDFYREMWRSLLEEKCWRGEIWNRRKDGMIYPENMTISAVCNDDGSTSHYIGLFSDISEQKAHQDELEYIAHHDPLTDLPNRTLSVDRLQMAIAQSSRHRRQLAVAYIDLDGFKDINDRYGHAAGDYLLTVVAKRMRDTLRSGDSIGRIGGDEFVAVLIDLCEATDCVPLLDRLLDCASRPVPMDDHMLKVSASIGVTTYPQKAEVDADQLLRQADRAMYQAKLIGKNRFQFFDEQQDRGIREHHEIIEALRRALIQNEFQLYYQPKVNMRTGKVVGVEALIRRHHPTQGLEFPSQFLPIIETHPLSIDLGEWVVESALTQIESWQSNGLNMAVSINIGALHLQQSDFIQRIQELLASHPAVRPQSLEVEILESSALEDVSHVSNVITACDELGIRFALDDFGTGFSSLSYVKRLPVDLLKVDRSFLRDVFDNPEDLVILGAVHDLARALDREVIAEGVETVERGVLLLQLGYELAQGYAIAYPMPAEKLPDWVAAWQPDPSWCRQQRIDREDVPTLIAAVEHRAWVKEIERHIQNREDSVPQLDETACRFGRWLKSTGEGRYASHSSFEEIKQLHHEIHAIANHVVNLHLNDETIMVENQIEKLHETSARLFSMVSSLVQGVD